MNATLKKRNSTLKRENVDVQIRRAKQVLRQLRDTLEDLEDRRDLARARERNAARAGVSWESAKKEFGFDF